jgi:hypothetical protein
LWFTEKKTWRLFKPEPHEKDESKSYAHAFEAVINGCDKKKLFELFSAESTPTCEVSMIYPFNVANAVNFTPTSSPVEYIEIRGGRASVEFMSHEFQAVPDVMIHMSVSTCPGVSSNVLSFCSFVVMRLCVLNLYLLSFCLLS